MPKIAPSLMTRALEAALALAQTKPWHAVTLIDIAAHADMAMSDLYGVVDKDKLTDALESWADGAMSAEAADMDDTPRERLFDIIMRRFEHMEPFRAGLLPIMQARERSPARLAALLKARRASAQWALSCAGLDHGTGTERAARTLGIAWVIGKTERAWRRDENEDFARTMATLDAELTRAEERLARLSRFSRHDKAPNATKAATSAPEARQEESDEA